MSQTLFVLELEFESPFDLFRLPSKLKVWKGWETLATFSPSLLAHSHLVAIRLYFVCISLSEINIVWTWSSMLWKIVWMMSALQHPIYKCRPAKWYTIIAQKYKFPWQGDILLHKASCFHHVVYLGPSPAMIWIIVPNLPQFILKSKYLSPAGGCNL